MEVPLTIFSATAGRTGDAVWGEMLAPSRSTIGRLQVLSSTYDSDIGRYCAEDLVMRFGERETDRVLRSWHGKIFAEWLNYALEEQFNDLDLFLSTLDRPGVAIHHWTQHETYRQWVPAHVIQAERDLFLSDFRILLLLNVRSSPPDAPEQVAHRVRTLIHAVEHAPPNLNIDLTSLSRTVGLSVPYAGKIFKRISGVSFRIFVRKVRMRRAATLLRTGSNTIKEVAALDGYGDVANFCRDFKALFGVTPTQSRRFYTGCAEMISDMPRHDSDNT